MRQGGPAVGNQFSEQRPVDVVEVFGGGHGRRLSQELYTVSASPNAATWQLSDMYGAEVPAYTDTYALYEKAAS